MSLTVLLENDLDFWCLRQNVLNAEQNWTLNKQRNAVAQQQNVFWCDEIISIKFNLTVYFWMMHCNNKVHILVGT